METENNNLQQVSNEAANDNVNNMDQGGNNFKQESNEPQNGIDTSTSNSNIQSQNKTDNNKERAPVNKGIAGTMESNFGADKTTTSTFEKSQGEKFGEKFDETGDLIKGKFSVSEEGGQPRGDAKASGSGAEHNKEHGSDSHNEGFGQKIKHKAEGMLHGHHDS